MQPTTLIQQKSSIRMAGSSKKNPNGEKIVRLDDVHAHTSGGAFHAANGGLDVEAVEIGHLNLRDLFHLLLGNLPDFVLVRFARSFGEANRPLDQNGHWRRL